MGRAARSALYEYGLWPDAGLLDAASQLAGRPVITRVQEAFAGQAALTVDFSYDLYWPPGDPDAALNEGSHHHLLRLEWKDRWEEGGINTNRIFALESHDEFYAGPLLTYHKNSG